MRTQYCYLSLVDHNLSIADDTHWHTVTQHALKDVEVHCLVMCLG